MDIKCQCSLGLGTSLSTSKVLEQLAILDAINAGYRHIDTAYVYQNEEEVGNAIRAAIANGVVTREELFVTTKLWSNCHKEEQVVPACRKSLAKLGLDYVDLYLIHWPFSFKLMDRDDLLPKDKDGNILFDDVDYLETWRGMEECVRLGLTSSNGISNFNSEQITQLLGAAKIKSIVNQSECKTVSRVHNGLDNSKILDIAKKYIKPPSQIALRYFQLGAVPIPKSVTKSRITENIKIFDFELTSDEMNTIKSLATGDRVAPFSDIKEVKYYPFSIVF